MLPQPLPYLPTALLSGQRLPGQRTAGAGDRPSSLHVTNPWGLHALETPPPSGLGEGGWQSQLPGAEGQTAQPHGPPLGGKCSKNI